MPSGAVARSYAEALFEIGGREGAREAFADAFDHLVRLLRDEPLVRTFLESPTVETGEKKAALRKAFEQRVPPLFLNFLLMVVDRRRQRLLPQMAAEYQALLDVASGRVHAEVTLAREPDERFEEEIASGLSRKLGRTVVPHFRVDPRIIGGAILRYDDRVLDGSLRHRLVSLRRRLMAAEVPGA